MTSALSQVSLAWLALGVLLHLGNQAARGRGWLGIVRAAHGGDVQLRRRDAVAAWIAGAGAAGVLAAQAGDALRVWLLSRRSPESGCAVFAGTLVAEAAGDFIFGLPVIVIAVMVGVGPAQPPLWSVLAVLAAVMLAVLAVRRLAPRWRVVDRVRIGCAPLGDPLAYARYVAPWQIASRALRLASLACCLMAFKLPVSPETVLAVVFAQASGKLLPFAPAALGAGVAVLAATFSSAAHQHVEPARLAAFLVGTTTLLTVIGVLAASVVVWQAADRQSLVRLVRRGRPSLWRLRPDVAVPEPG